MTVKKLKQTVSWLLAVAMLVTLLPALPVSAVEPVEYDAVFLSDLHNGVGGYQGLIQMMEELPNEGQSPRVLSHGGDYVEDSRGGQVDWQTQVYDVISGTERAAFPDAAQVYTLGNHDWETGTFGGRTDKEAAFKEMFGFPRCGLAYADDELEIYMIGSQCATGSGGGNEAFETADIAAFDSYLESRVDSGKVIFLQTHWPGHSSYNWKQRNVTNADLMIDTLNKYGDDLDIVWVWGHNHYEDTMRHVVLQPGDEILYAADSSSTWDHPRNPKKKTINFTYANAGCMNDIHNLPVSAGAPTYRGPSACLSVAVDEQNITFTYNRIQQVNGVWTFSHDADIYIQNRSTNLTRPGTVVVPRSHGGEPLPLDFSALEAAITAAETLDMSPYTDASVADVRTALEAAIAARNAVRQAEINRAEAALRSALAALKLKPVPLDAAFVRADRIEAGKSYVIVADGQYAMTNEAVPAKETYSGLTATRGAVPVQIENGQITGEVYGSMLWTFRPADGASAAYDGMKQYYLTDCDGQYLCRGSMANSNAGLNLTAAVGNTKRYYTWSFKPYADEAGTFAMYANSERAYGSDYAGRVRGEADGFDIPGGLTQRTAADPFAFMNDGVCSHITLYVDSDDAPVPLSYTALEAAIAAAEAVDTGLYTAASVRAMQTALSNAEAARQAETQAEIDAAAAALNDAVAALVPKPVLDYTALEAAIAAAEAVDTSLYTAASVRAMQTALSNAEAARQAETQAEIDDAANALNAAVAALVPKPVLNYTALEAAIAAAEAVDASLYTAASVAALQTALGNAIAARTAETQAEIDSAAAALQSAIAALEEKPLVNATFVLADRIEAGKTYVIVADGQYAMTNEAVPAKETYSGLTATRGAVPVQIENGQITGPVDESMLWTFTDAGAGYDGVKQYYLTDCTGLYLRRGSMSKSNAGLTLDASRTQNNRYYTWSFAPYADEAATFAMYANTERAYGTDYAGRVRGEATGFDIPGGLTQRTADDPFAFMNDGVCSHITLYIDSEDAPAPLDYTALEAAIAAAEAVDTSLYTDDSVSALQTALGNAIAARTAETQAEIDSAANALNEAIQALKRKDLPAPGVFVRAEQIEVGETYVIVADGQYAMTNEAVPAKERYYNGLSTTRGSVPVEIAGRFITGPVDSSMLWTVVGTEGVAAAYDGMPQYFLTDAEGSFLGRGSMRYRNGGLVLTATRTDSDRHYAWSFREYENEAATFAMYTNSDRAYGTDYAGRVGGNASGFDIPATLDHRTADDPFAFMNDSACSHITLYRQCCTEGHSYEAAVTAPTCTEAGFTTYTCAECGDSYIADEVPALGHDLIAHGAKEPTCTEIGWEAYEECARCDYSTYHELPATGHTPGGVIEENRVEATCTAPGGYDEVVYCTVCLAELRREAKETPALGHALIAHAAKAPTCTEVGWNAYQTCSRCDYTTYEELPATGHTPGGVIEENRVEATCTAPGGYDEVVYCTVCGDEISREAKETPALGHDYVTTTVPPTADAQGYDEHVCTRCGDAYRDSYVEPLGPAHDDSLKFKTISISLYSNISMNFFVADSVLKGWSEPYVVFKKAKYNAKGVITGYETRTVREFKRTKTPDGTPCHSFTFTDIVSSEMGSDVTATLYARKNGAEYEGRTITYSVLKYASTMLSVSSDAKLRTLLVDLLNYGASAQKYFKYNTANLVNAGLTDEQRALATPTDPEAASCLKLVKNPGATVGFKTCSLTLNDSVAVNFFLNLSGYTGSLSDLQARIKYVDQNGKSQTAVIDSEAFVKMKGSDGATYNVVRLSTLQAMQMRTVLTAEIYSKSTGERISDTVTYSIESYVQAMQSSSDSKLAELVRNMLKYGDSAYRYFKG